MCLAGSSWPSCCQMHTWCSHLSLW
jgi:hypothetical protein